MTKTISIIGCGWLGLPLAIRLKALGHEVHGSTTTNAKLQVLKANGIIPHFLDLNQADADLTKPSALFNSDVVIITIPPRVRKFGAAYGKAQIANLLSKDINGKVVYTSSTGVYPMNNAMCFEKDMLPSVNNVDSHPILAIEHMLVSEFGSNLTILRLAGLFGKDRFPMKYFKDKPVINSDVPVNYLHQEDAINAIREVVKQNLWGKIYNIVTPQHPKKKQVLIRNASDFKMDLPTFLSGKGKNYKVINGDKFVQEAGFEYQFPDPVLFTYD